MPRWDFTVRRVRFLAISWSISKRLAGSYCTLKNGEAGMVVERLVDVGALGWIFSCGMGRAGRFMKYL